MQEFSKKIAVVTGASSGIGRALALESARQGMRVVIADVDEAGLDETARLLEELGCPALCVPTDVTRPESVDALADAAYDRFGAVHLLCNNAGVIVGGSSWEIPIEDYQWVLGVNTFGVVHGVKSFVPRMLAQDCEGHIVNTASMAAVTSLPFTAAYHMSKHAVLALSECLYHELTLTQSKLRVSVLCPELINTGIDRSERSRPAHLAHHDPDAGPSASAALVMQALREGMQRGLDPEVMADRVFAAVRDERFYILSEESWRDICNTRLDDIRLGRNPTFRAPTT